MMAARLEHEASVNWVPGCTVPAQQPTECCPRQATAYENLALRFSLLSAYSKRSFELLNEQLFGELNRCPSARLTHTRTMVGGIMVDTRPLAKGT